MTAFYNLSYRGFYKIILSVFRKLSYHINGAPRQKVGTRLLSVFLFFSFRRSAAEGKRFYNMVTVPSSEISSVSPVFTVFKNSSPN